MKRSQSVRMLTRSVPLKSTHRSSLQRYGLDVLLVGLTVFWDIFSVALAYAVAYQWRALAPNSLYSADFYWSLAQYSGLTTLLVFAALGLYRLPGHHSRFDEAIRVLIGVTIAFTLVLAGAFFFREASFSRLVVLSAWALGILSLSTGRLVLQQLNRALRQAGFGLRPVLVIGTGKTATNIGELLSANPQWGLRMAGFVAESEGRCEALPVVAHLDGLGDYIRANPVGEVWFSLPDWPRRETLELVQIVLGSSQARVRFVPDILEFVTARMRVDVLGGMALLTLQDTPLRLWHNRVLKRTFDIVLAGSGLLVALPGMALIALALKWTSSGPIFYSQERIGRDGEVFRIYKFRTMRVDAEQSGPGWTVRGDPRCTPFGGWLRHTSLDELPQLWNVLLGDMSLVGPRPERPIYVERFSQDIPKYLDRHLVKTGITGWAQIHGLRGDSSIAERVRYDLYYVENWSLALDLRIVLVTALQIVFNPEDAY